MITIDERMPLEFAEIYIVKFIKMMRENEWILRKPSPRQPIRMYRLLMFEFMKKGYLDFKDLIKISVVTSFPDSQDIALDIANQILSASTNTPLDFKNIDRTQEQALMDYLDASQKADLLMTRDESAKETKEDESEIGDGIEFEKYENKPAPGVGPGLDLILRNYFKKSVDEEEQKAFLKELKRKLVMLGWEYQSIGRTVESDLLRPYELGDDPQLIDEEKSIENIFIDEGKTIDEIEYSDFFMRKKEIEHRTPVFVLDMSNTMHFELNGISSMHYSILCLVPLVFAFRLQNYGLALFESNTHVIKEMYEERDWDTIVDTLISLIPMSCTDMQKKFATDVSPDEWGGTVPNSSLSWTNEQLKLAKKKSSKFCFVFSDFQFEEPDVEDPKRAENYRLMKEMVDEGIKVFACVSPVTYLSKFTPFSQPVLEKMKETGCEILSVANPRNFLENVRDIIEKSSR